MTFKLISGVMENENIWMFMLLSCMITMVVGARSCDIRPVPACTCWNPRRPVISCVNAGLTKLPSLPVDYIESLDLSYNKINISFFDALGHYKLVLTRFIMTHSLLKRRESVSIGYLFRYLKKSIKWLDLSYNRNLITYIPSAVNTLSNLEHLDIS